MELITLVILTSKAIIWMCTATIALLFTLSVMRG